MMGGGDAKALIIRYSFTGGSPDYHGGTIDVASLDQTLGTGPVTFTVDVFNNTYTVVSSFLSGSSSEIDFQTTACGGICFESWNPSYFNFAAVPGGSVTANTTWRSLLGTFNGTSFFNSNEGNFEWSNSAISGQNSPRPTAITFSAPNASVPGPLPAMGTAAAFGWSRRLRKRITAKRVS
jgi:hypothetical protein